MRTERAIAILKGRKEFVADINIDGKVAYEMAIDALEKSIPCKVEEHKDSGFYCGCGVYLAPTKCVNIKYCISCGRKLDWE